MSKHIVVIPGDGIGEEITAAALGVLKKVCVKAGINITCEEHLAGGVAIDRYGLPLPENTLEAVGKADAVLLGAVGGPKWDAVAPDIRPEKAILGLRKALGLYANLRPIRVVPCLTEFSPLKPEKISGVDILIVRELNGGIYYGSRCESEIVDNVECAWDVEMYSVPEVTRIMNIAFSAARVRRNKVTSVDKANVLASSRLWRRTCVEVARNFNDVSLDHFYIDNCAMQLMLNPREFDVIVTSNLFGDILSDEAAVLAGSIGMLPSASIGEGAGLYEPIHGSAPDIAGKGIANPIGTILSAAMLLRHSFGEDAAAAMVEQAVDRVLADGYRTADLYKIGTTKVSTEKMGKLVELKIT